MDTYQNVVVPQANQLKVLSQLFLPDRGHQVHKVIDGENVIWAPTKGFRICLCRRRLILSVTLINLVIQSKIALLSAKYSLRTQLVALIVIYC